MIFRWKFFVAYWKFFKKICMKLKHWLFCLSIIELRRSGGMEFEVWPCLLPATPCYVYSKVLPTPKTGGTTILPPKTTTIIHIECTCMTMFQRNKSDIYFCRALQLEVMYTYPLNSRFELLTLNIKWVDPTSQKQHLGVFLSFYFTKWI